MRKARYVHNWATLTSLCYTFGLSILLHPSLKATSLQNSADMLYERIVNVPVSRNDFGSHMNAV